MSKTYIRTRDIFNIENENVNQRYLKYCYEKAIKFGIQCKKHMNEQHFMVLELSGSKYQLAKYYLVTMLKTSNKLDGVKRLISILTT